MSWTNRILLAVFIVVAVALLPRYDGVGSEDLSRVQQERIQLVDENAGLRDDIQRLEAEVTSLKRDGRDPRSMAMSDRETARIAREDLNLVKAGEFVFELERPQPSRSHAAGKGSTR
jgi:cell division protein FtsB